MSGAARKLRRQLARDLAFDPGKADNILAQLDAVFEQVGRALNHLHELDLRLNGLIDVLQAHNMLPEPKRQTETGLVLPPGVKLP